MVASPAGARWDAGGGAPSPDAGGASPVVTGTRQISFPLLVLRCRLPHRSPGWRPACRQNRHHNARSGSAAAAAPGGLLGTAALGEAGLLGTLLTCFAGGWRLPAGWLRLLMGKAADGGLLPTAQLPLHTKQLQRGQNLQ